MWLICFCVNSFNLIFLSNLSFIQGLIFIIRYLSCVMLPDNLFRFSSVLFAWKTLGLIILTGFFFFVLYLGLWNTITTTLTTNNNSDKSNVKSGWEERESVMFGSYVWFRVSLHKMLALSSLVSFFYILIVVLLVFLLLLFMSSNRFYLISSGTLLYLPY
jgi:hypothetical protein